MTDASVTARALAARLAALLASIDSGEMTASAATRYRIEGAIVALDVLNGTDTADILDRLGDGQP